MHCSKCGSDNPVGKKFCSECGAPMLATCRKCGAENFSAAKFCGECGTALSSPAGASSAPEAVSAKSEAVDTARGERRHLTVLFCDLVGSTAIAARLDAEEWRETLAGFHRVAAAAITQFDGYVAKNLGDGVMAYFGWPQAHDNDAERAARAGLAILDAISKLNDQPGHAKLSARVGIDSGAVVMGKGIGSEVDVFGDTSNIASRVEGEAASGTVAISAATHRLLAGLFVVEDLGAHELKGIEQPVQLYRVVRPSGARGRFEAATAAGGLTPFVGREDELRTLTSRWQRALDGDGQVALIIGEAGIGKSRLLQRFHEQIADTPHTWIGAGAGAFFQNTPFYPVVEMLRQFVGDTPVEDQIAQLESRLELAGLKPADAIPLIAPLLNLPLPTQYSPSTLSPEQQRRRLLATLVEWVLGSAGAQPLVIATEDLHWVDPSTLELIQLLVEQGATARLLLLYTARPEFHAPWPMRAHHTQITLNRLSPGNVRTMVAQVAASKALADDTIATLVERTGGIPLFVEELTRDMLERGGGSTPREIPATLHDSLMARLDRLGPDKEVLQIGAVMGSEFSYELLHAVHSIAETDLQRALRAGTDAELLYVRGIAPDATYQFKHALIRDAAYEALLKTRRKELHRTVARTIDEQFPTLKETHPEVLARHWTEAGEIEPAVAAWQKAGERAATRSALVEAERHYISALHSLGSLSENLERDRHELGIQIGLGLALWGAKGWAHTETHGAFTRAQELAERLGDTRQLVLVLHGLAVSASVGGRVRIGQELAEREVRLAELTKDQGLLSAANYILGNSFAFGAKFAQAQKHHALARSYFNESDAQRLPAHGGNYAAVDGLVNLQLGFPDRGRSLLNEAIQMAERRNNSFDLAFSRMCLCTYLIRLRDPQALHEQVDHLSRLANQHPFFNGYVDYYAGMEFLMQNNLPAGLSHMRRAAAFWEPIGFKMTRAWEIAAEALLCESEGRIEDALDFMEDALSETEEFLWLRPVMLTLRADILAKRTSSGPEIELAYREAIQLSFNQDAKFDQLQSSTHFARWLKSEERTAEAHAILAEIYNWFTEGFDTLALNEAEALLEELSR